MKKENKKEFSVNIKRSRKDAQQDLYLHLSKYLVGCDKEKICRNILKKEFATLIHPLIINTNINSIEITNILLDDIDLSIYTKSDIDNSIILFNEIYNLLTRLSIEVSIQNGIDMMSYINNNIKTIEDICLSVYTLLTSK